MAKSVKDVNELTYEQAIAELEKLVARLEAEQLALEEALNLFERGQVLGQHCALLLDQAELRVRQLTGEKE
jgi:exodeoxyribonuclease VII small subunit